MKISRASVRVRDVRAAAPIDKNPRLRGLHSTSPRHALQRGTCSHETKRSVSSKMLHKEDKYNLLNVRFDETVPAFCRTWTPRCLPRRRWWSQSPVSYLSMAFPCVAEKKIRWSKKNLYFFTLSDWSQRKWAGVLQVNVSPGDWFYGLSFWSVLAALMPCWKWCCCRGGSTNSSLSLPPPCDSQAHHRAWAHQPDRALAPHWRHYHAHVRLSLRHYSAWRTMHGALQILQSG